MDIHIVKPGENIYSIADRYGISVEKLTLDNGISEVDSLVIGQSLVIAYPQQTYIVQEGDTLGEIAAVFDSSVMQLIRNNIFLLEREHIYPGEILVISYDTTSEISTNGFALPFIDKRTLKATLPYLTYLTIFNYGALNGGDIKTYYDDTEMIALAKAYGVAPLMSLTTLSLKGTENIEVGMNILRNKEYQEIHINNILDILKVKGYYGLNISFLYLSDINRELYVNFLNKIAARLNNAGVPVYVTVDPQLYQEKTQIFYQTVEYSFLAKNAENVTFMNYTWGASLEGPGPIISCASIDASLQYIIKAIPIEKVVLGTTTLGYDWELPYIAGYTKASAIAYNDVINLARDVGAIIQFDEESQTPFFEYKFENRDHIVWFIDARSLNGLLCLLCDYQLRGISIWNIMKFNAQLWTLINSQYEIEKVVKQ